MPSKSKKNSCGCHHAEKSGTSPLRAFSLPKKTSRTLREVHASRTYLPEHVAYVSDRLPLSATSLNKIAVDKFIHGVSKRQESTHVVKKEHRGTQTTPQASAIFPTTPTMINPETGRPIMVGGVVYKGLQRRGIIP